MHKRILFGLVAWLLDAATATAGSLLAVSLLGKGIGGGSAQQLTAEAVNRALASEIAESSPAVTPSPSPSPSRTVHQVSKPAVPSPSATHEPPPAATPSQPAAQSPGSGSGGGTVFTSKGGNVLASCQAAGAYLLSWSPLQGYEVGFVVRGPASAARVTFESDRDRVTMVVTCSAGVPSATTSTWADE